LTSGGLGLSDHGMHALRPQLLSKIGGLALLAAVGCQPPTPDAVGEIVGVYAINGALIANTCGQTALPTTDPLKFEVEIRQNDQVGYWQVSKQAPQTGELEADNSFKFSGQTTSLVSSMRGARNDLEPGDFINLTPDFDLKTTTCSMKITETIEGSLARRFVTGDAGTPELEAAGTKPKHDLTGDNTIAVEATPESDCSASLMTFGGPFANLPCMAHYALSGDLQEMESLGK
jgi:hypothetical protein